MGLSEEPRPQIGFYDAVGYLIRRSQSAGGLWCNWFWPPGTLRKKVGHWLTTGLLLAVLGVGTPKLLPDEIGVVTALVIAGLGTVGLGWLVAYTAAGARMEKDLEAHWRQKRSGWWDKEKGYKETITLLEGGLQAVWKDQRARFEDTALLVWDTLSEIRDKEAGVEVPRYAKSIISACADWPDAMRGDRLEPEDSDSVRAELTNAIRQQAKWAYPAAGYGKLSAVEHRTFNLQRKALSGTLTAWAQDLEKDTVGALREMLVAMRTPHGGTLKMLWYLEEANALREGIKCDPEPSKAVRAAMFTL